jgi:hypothetical protein
MNKNIRELATELEEVNGEIEDLAGTANQSEINTAIEKSKAILSDLISAIPEGSYTFAEADVTAKNIDMKSLLVKGEVDVTDYSLSEIRETLPYKSMQDICKRGKARLYPYGPVGITRMGVTKKSIIAMEAGARYFDTTDEIVTFMREHKGLVVYEIIKCKVPKIKYILRNFSNREYDYISLSPIMYLYNRITTWKGYTKALNKRMATDI